MVTDESLKHLFTGLNQSTSHIYSLVLEAKNIHHRCVKDPTGWSIFVDQDQLSSAEHQIKAYLKENREASTPAPSPIYNIENNYSMLWVIIFLIAIHLASGSGFEKKVMVKGLGASSEKILNGELFRCITALTLHSDASHLIANSAGLLLFGTLLCRLLGTGSGWLLILLGGGSGNLFNALLHKSSHLSIGASTAVFSTLGSLTALSIYKKIKNNPKKLNALLPLGGGIALLAFLGADPQTDLLAHLFGFIGGLFWMTLWIWTFPKKLTAFNQWGLALLSTAIMIGAWIQGLQSP